MNFLNSPFAKMMNVTGVQGPWSPKKSSSVAPAPSAGDGTNMQGDMWTTPGGAPPVAPVAQAPAPPGDKDGALKNILKKIFAGGM